MRLSIEYTNPKSRLIICDAVDKIEKDMDVHPEVLHRRIDEGKGAFSIEFSGRGLCLHQNLWRVYRKESSKTWILKSVISTIDPRSYVRGEGL